MQRKLKLKISVAAAFAALTLYCHGEAAAQSAYPNRPIRMIVPVSAGGGTDGVARDIAQQMGIALKQSVVVENKPGAGGTIGTMEVIRAKPDGYTLLVMNEGLTINPSLMKVSFDPEKDLIPVALLTTSPNVLTAHPSLQANNVKELIALAKAKPGAISIGVSAGQMSHIAAAMFAQSAGIDLTIVPYKGNAHINTDLLGGQVQMSFGSAWNSLPGIKTGKLKAIGVGGSETMKTLPGVETIAKTLPGFEATSWIGLFVPAGTPQPIIDRLRKEALDSLKAPAVVERLEREGSSPAGQISIQQFSAQISREITKWDTVVKKGKLKIE